jgi:hypothetical protein
MALATKTWLEGFKKNAKRKQQIKNRLMILFE